jgi:hypothetical protein
MTLIESAPERREGEKTPLRSLHCRLVVEFDLAQSYLMSAIGP